MSKNVIVIGSGFGGLAVAVRLAARGYRVTILEKRDKPADGLMCMNWTALSLTAAQP